MGRGDMADSSFDVIAFLEEHGIEHWQGSKNSGRGWVGIQCIFCTDHSNHLGINLDSGIFSCFKCGAKGGFPKYAKELLQSSWAETYAALEPFASTPSRNGEEPPVLARADPRWRSKNLPIPKYFSKKFPRRHLDYLAGRGFNPGKLIEKYDLYACSGIGRFRWRIVAPVHMGGKIVNFIGRDVTGKSDRKYLLEKNEIAPVPKGQILYNLDNVPGETIIIVEGPADVWRIGDGAVATIGTKFSMPQVERLMDYGIRRAFVLYDPEPEALRLAKRLANQLQGVIDEATVLVKQTPGDPGDMSPDEVIELRRRVFQ